MENELKEEFAKIDKMNSRERLEYIREYITFHKQVGLSDDNTFEAICDRLLFITKGYQSDGEPAIL